MTVSIEIASATPRQRNDILRLVRAAFSTNGRDGHEEVAIVEQTWAVESDRVDRPGFESVAIIDDTVVGHVMAAYGQLNEHNDVLAVAPLAVAPSHQGQGVGRALMTDLLRRTDAAGISVVLLGSPALYSRFGFEPASRYDMTYPVVGAGNPHFQLRRASGSSAPTEGTFRYCWEEPPP